MRTTADTEPGLAPGGVSTPPDVPAGEARLDPANPDSILVTWDEAIAASAAQAAAYVNAGNAALSATLVTPRVVRVTFAVAPGVGDLLEIAAASAQDRAGNAAVADIAVTLAAADAVAPTASVSGTAVENDGGDFVTISYDEPMDLTGALDLASYTVTNGGAVSLSGATARCVSATHEVTLWLASGVHLDTSQPLDVVITGVTDVAGNALAAQPATDSVGGDSTEPSIAAAFVNHREDIGATVVEVHFDEDVDPTLAGDPANWTGSNGQLATAVDAIGLRTYRITFDAAIGNSDTVDLADVRDLAGNTDAGLGVDPVE
jgi:hypothetical protein